MKYDNVKEAIFLERPNRFVAVVLVDGVEEKVHVKNTGRCEELLVNGIKVALTGSDNPNRKTKYDLISVFSPDYGWVNIDSQAPNELFREWLSSEGNDLLPDVDYIKPECQFGESRIDYYLEKDDRKILVELKGCTLQKLGMGYFPDAPSERAVKHLREMIEARKEGYECFIAFAIQMNGITHVMPNRTLDPDFADALRDAIKSGVRILNLRCMVKRDEVVIESYGTIDYL